MRKATELAHSLAGSTRLQPIADGCMGLEFLVAGQPHAALPKLRSFLDWLADPTGSATVELRALWTVLACLVDDPRQFESRAQAVAGECRTSGAVESLPAALTTLAIAQVMIGHQAAALASLGEADRLATALPQPIDVAHTTSDVALQLAAIAGDEQRCRTLANAAAVHALPTTRAAIACDLALLDLGLGRNHAALTRLEGVLADSANYGRVVWLSLPSLVEAAAYVGEPHRAEEAQRRFEDLANAGEQDWMRSVLLRCQALLADVHDAGGLFAEAARLGTRGANPFEQARTQLLYGSWLRRHRRTSEARPCLRDALEVFDHLNAHPWADRARTELHAAGEIRQAGRRPRSVDALTPQEYQVVRLAADGLSNRAIAARLFLSPRTVGHHLYRAFPKLGVSSRHELAKLDLN